MKYKYGIAALGLLTLTGCRKEGGHTGLVVFLLLFGALLLALAAARTYRKVCYIKKRQREGRRVKMKPNVLTGALYVLTAAAFLAASLVSCNAPSSPPPADTETTVTTTTTAAPTWMRPAADRELTADQYFVYDVNAKQFTVIAEDENERIYPASITKLFTAYVAMQYLQSDDQITAGDALDRVVYGSSVADIEKGEVYTAATLVEAMLLPSGNDAAYLLATEVGRKLGSQSDDVDTAVARFVDEMNAQAVAKGMTNTHFANPDGIHSDDHYTTYHDLAILGTLALDNADICRYAATAHDTVTPVSGTAKTWKNTNKLIDPATTYYCDACIGLKTGQTPYAGSCLLSAFRYGEHTWLIGVFGCPEDDDRFPDTLQLFNKTIGLS